MTIAFALMFTAAIIAVFGVLLATIATGMSYKHDGDAYRDLALALLLIAALFGIVAVWVQAFTA